MDWTEFGDWRLGYLLAWPRLTASVPGAPRGVAWLFLASGFAGLVVTTQSMTRGGLELSPLLIGIPIAVGLLRLDPGWRVAAMTVSVLFILASGLWLLQILSGGEEFVSRMTPDLAPFLFTGTWLLLLQAFAAAWAIAVLRSPSVRSRFEAAHAMKSDALRIARAIIALLAVAALLGACRATGGIDSVSLSGSGSGGQSLGLHSSKPQKLDYPLIVEVRGNDITSYIVVADWLRFEGERSEQIVSKTIYKRYNGRVAPEAVTRDADRIIAEIDDVQHWGLTRTPLLKAGTLSCRIRLIGAGRYSSLNIEKKTSRYYWILGPCTTEEALDKVRRDLEGRILSWIQNHDMAALKEVDPDALEAAWRARPLRDPEVTRLAYLLRRRGDNYFEARDFRSASRAYEDCLICLETELAQLDRRSGSRERVVRSDLAAWSCHIAWRLATDPRPEARDGAMALELARRGCDLLRDRRDLEVVEGEAYEALAAAHAEVGDFAGAIRWQKHAIALRLKEALSRRISLFRGRFELPDNLSNASGPITTKLSPPSKLGEADDPALAEYQAGRPFRDANPAGSLRITEQVGLSRRAVWEGH